MISYYFRVTIKHVSPLISSLPIEPLGGVGGGNYLHMTKYRCACQIPAPPGKWLTPIFNKNVYEWPYFLMLVYEWLKFSDTHVYACIFRMKGYINSKDGQYMYMNMSSFFEIKYMKGLFFQRPGIWLGLVSKYWLADPCQNYPHPTPHQPQEIEPLFFKMVLV